MSPVIQTPSFWDYLGNAIQQGQQGFDQARARVEKHKQEGLQHLMTMASLGLIDSNTASKAASDLGYPDLQFAPGQQEIARNIAGIGQTPTTGAASAGMTAATGGGVMPVGPVVTPPRNVADMRAYAKLPTQGQQAVDQEQGTKATIQTNAMLGKPPVNAVAAAMAEVPTTEQISNAEFLNRDKVTDLIAEQSIDKALAPLIQAHNGRLPLTGYDDAAREAADDINKTRVSSGLAPLPNPLPLVYAKLRDRLDKQRELDIKQTAAENAGGRGAALTPDQRLYQDVTNALTSRNGAIRVLVEGDPTLPMKLQAIESNPNSPFAKDQTVKRYQALITNYNELVEKQKALEVKLGLAPAEEISAGGGGQQTGGGGAAQGSGQPQGVNMQSVAKIVSNIRNKKITNSDAINQLQAAVSAGTMSQATADAVISQLGVGTTSGTRRRGPQ